MVPFINLLSIVLRCNDFAGIHKAVVDQTSRRPPVIMTLFGTSLGSALELLLSPTTELVIANSCIKSTFHHMSESNQEMVHCCVE